MKGKGARLLLRALGLLVLVSLILAMVGCGDGGGGGGGDKDAIALMKKLPKGTDSFMFVDIKSLRTDDDLEDLYDSFSEDSGDMTSMFGADMEDISFWAMAGEMMFVLQGDFDEDEVTEALEQTGYEKSDYEGVEVWAAMGFAAALVDDSTLVFASDTDVKACVDVIKGEEKSLYEASGVKDDMGKLPGDALIVAWGGAGESFFADETYTGLEATAISMSKKNADTVQATAVMRFEDSASAKDAMDDVEADMKADSETEVTNLKVTQDGEYIKATAEMDLDENLFS